MLFLGTLQFERVPTKYQIQSICEMNSLLILNSTSERVRTHVSVSFCQYLNATPVCQIAQYNIWVKHLKTLFQVLMQLLVGHDCLICRLRSLYKRARTKHCGVTLTTWKVILQFFQNKLNESLLEMYYLDCSIQLSNLISIQFNMSNIFYSVIYSTLNSFILHQVHYLKWVHSWG